MFHLQKNLLRERLNNGLLVFKVVLHAVVLIQKALRSGTKSRCGRCCMAHLWSSRSRKANVNIAESTNFCYLMLMFTSCRNSVYCKRWIQHQRFFLCRVVSFSKSVFFRCEQGRQCVRRCQEVQGSSRWATRKIDCKQI